MGLFSGINRGALYIREDFLLKNSVNREANS